jgi:hypothetical protein
VWRPEVCPLKTRQLPYINTFQSIRPDLTVLRAFKIDRLLGRNKIDDNRRTDRIKFFSLHRPREDS